MAMSTSTAPWVPGARSASGAESTTSAVPLIRPKFQPTVNHSPVNDEDHTRIRRAKAAGPGV
jgi:hypothetical protein